MRAHVFGLASVLISLGAIGCHAVEETPQADFIRKYAAIKKTMTEKEVQKLLGAPSEETAWLIPLQGTVPPPPLVADLPEFDTIVKASWKNWIIDEDAIVVLFDSNRHVIGKGLVGPAAERMLKLQPTK